MNKEKNYKTVLHYKTCEILILCVYLRIRNKQPLFPQHTSYPRISLDQIWEHHCSRPFFSFINISIQPHLLLLVAYHSFELFNPPAENNWVLWCGYQVQRSHRYFVGERRKHDRHHELRVSNKRTKAFQTNVVVSRIYSSVFLQNHKLQIVSSHA